MKCSYLVVIFLFGIILGCPPLYEIDPHNTTVCKMCGIEKITVTYDNQPCIFYNKKTPGYTWSQLHHTIYRITCGFRDLLLDNIIYNSETKWSQEACIMKFITNGNKEKAIIISRILNLIYKYIRGRDIFDKLICEKYCSSFYCV